MVDGESSEDVQLDVLLFASVDECVSGKLENIDVRDNIDIIGNRQKAM